MALKIVSSAVYWTNKLEVWSKLSSKERVYDQMIACSKAYICKNTPDSLKLQMKKVQDNKLTLGATANHYYNQGVMSTFSGISNLPITIAGLYDKAVDQLNAPPTKKSPQ